MPLKGENVRILGGILYPTIIEVENDQSEDKTYLPGIHFPLPREDEFLGGFGEHDKPTPINKHSF